MKDLSKLAALYQHIRESEDPAGQVSSGVSYQYQNDPTVKFLPVGQDKEEEDEFNKSKRVYDRIKTVFANMKALINSCSSEKISLSNLSKLIDFMDNPQVRGDLEELKTALQEENLENGNNSRLSSF